MAIEIQPRDLQIMRFAFTYRVVTYSQIHRKFFAKNHDSASRNRINLLCKHGYIRSLGNDSNGRLQKCVRPTEKSWDLIAKSWGYDVDRPHFQSESVEHDFRLAEVSLKFERLTLFRSLVTENLLQSSSYLASHPHYRDLVNRQSDAVLSLKDSDGTEFLYAIELEVSKKSPDRYHQKLSAYYKAGGIDGVIYVCGSQEITDTIARIDREVRTTESSVVYLGLEVDVLKNNQKMIFKASDGAGIGLF